MRSRRSVILCIDDEEVALDLRKRVLERRGYTVLTATDGSEALAAIRSRRVDLILSDHLLKAGETGTALAARLKRLRPDVPIAIYSGVTELPNDLEYVDLFITKLDSPEELFEKITELLQKSKAKRFAG
jgi:two-component system cell cycle sensor histidine kinase/response regulator CckA